MPGGGGVGSWALPVAKVVETEQRKLSTFGCYGGSVLEDTGTGKKEQVGDNLKGKEMVALEYLGELEQGEN